MSRVSRAVAGALLVLSASLGAGTSTALAGPSSPQAVVVSLGDSYISGEAGRWAGNSVSATPGNDGTDRACLPAGSPLCQVDKSRVYVDGSAANGCHRSDVAEVLSARLPGATGVNIACSGAVTKNLLRASSGGVGQNGEAPEGDQLATIAREKAVKLLVVSIGGNDLGFASIVAACLTAYTSKSGPCNPAQQAALRQKLPQAQAAVEGVIDDLRAVMAGAGYARRDYRLVLQTYPSVVPRAAEARYAESSPERSAFGCPFYDADLDWARTQAAPQIGGMVRAAARARGAEVLELIDLLQGHEICSRDAAEATPTAQPPAQTSEWGRFLGASTVQQGDLQEAFHPNAFAQRAIGACLSAVFAARPGEFACSNAAGRAPEAVRFARTRAITGASPGAGAARS